MTIMMQMQVNLYVQVGTFEGLFFFFLLGWLFSLVVCYFFSLFPFFSFVKIPFYLDKIFDYLNYPAMMFSLCTYCHYLLL
ncbi:uncharacterized protein BX664DRAFT_333033 [Halteromyces radiatus]|uniref:uncharacterized protein n=1 Tax=Halteromyces radiatus TaxID=101107 RepID=UPI00221F8929|nr:uncharacterized protein BX664DRAFT_333033 [Halteromyces radiatus]KAI8089442.1 hypothetical protein BX664DRAFT_333033 [Halteromyces radiatus]